MGGGETKTVTTTSDQSPWAQQQPFLVEGFNRARGLLDSDAPQYYPGQTVTDTPAATTQGQAGQLGAAGISGDLRNATASGAFLNAGNPYFSGLVEQIGQAIRPQIDSTFASTGRYGSGAHANAFSSALADQAGRLAYQNYGDERGRQIAAAQDYSPFQAQMQVGSQQEAKEAQYIADALARWDFAQNRDINKLAQYMQLVGNRSYGGTSQQTQPYTSNPFLQTVGTTAGLLGGLGQFATGIKGLF